VDVRILICADEAPIEPTTSGFRRAVSGLVDELCREHDVRVLGFRKPDQAGGPPASHIRLIEWPSAGLAGKARLLGSSLLARRPVRTTELAAVMRGPLLEELVTFRPEVVQVTPARLSGLVSVLEGHPKVLMAMDAWHLNLRAKSDASRGLRRAFLESQERAVRRSAPRMYRPWDRIVVSSSDDGEAIRSLDPTLRYTVIPIGVDARALSPDPTVARDPSSILFHGVMSYAPNVQAAEFLATRVLPLVRERQPDARLSIVGRDPVPRVIALDALPGVTVTGQVEDLRPWLCGSRVWVGPFLSATGIKTKVLEAMACGLPCVVTPLGKRGLEMTPDAEILVGVNERELADHVVHMLDDDEAAERIGRAARERLLQTYDWPAVRRAYERLYAEVAATLPRPLSTPSPE
jgi:glycosyltransferase involved in cell wall biosynthesis